MNTQESISMRNYRRILLAAVVAVMIALGIATQSPAQIASNQPASEQVTAGSNARNTYGRESS